jgi:hypothetical protein
MMIDLLLADEAFYKAYAMENGISGAEFDRRARIIKAAQEEYQSLLKFRDGVRQCQDDKLICERCGHEEDWWRGSNADYLTREETPEKA